MSIRGLLTPFAYALGFLALGFLIGAGVNVGSRYKEGRLSACTEIIGGLVANVPMFAEAQFSCVEFKGDAAINVGSVGKIFSLDGEKQLN